MSYFSTPVDVALSMKAKITCHYHVSYGETKPRQHDDVNKKFQLPKFVACSEHRLMVRSDNMAS